MPTYNPKAIEPRWQRYWLDHKTFRTPDVADKPKLYVLDMFPYPSGSGLHVGHPEGYTATDILCRYRRMRGFNVLHPMGWDAFGLPAEQHAVKTGTHPRINTQENVANFRRQIQMLGFSYDWDREVDTTDPHYFKWTQWIFLVLFDTWYDAKLQRGRPIAELAIPPAVTAQGAAAVRAYQDGKRLAYQAEVPVNWCDALGTVLANEEVKDGKSERGGHPVVRMPLRQWLLRITAYAERLLADLDQVNWPEPIKKMQRDWIGRSEGAEVDFKLESPPSPGAATPGPDSIRVFTTRPDTLFGATYMVLAPEHPLVDLITTPKQKAAVEKYQADAARKSERERTEDVAKLKTGVFTGARAVNPVNGEPIPIWIADYVLSSYGTGAIMAVPAHDVRDFAFAKQFHLPIKTVVKPSEDWLKKTSFYANLDHLQSGGKDTDLPTTLTPQAGTLLRNVLKMMKQGLDSVQMTERLYLDGPSAFDEVFVEEGVAVHSGQFDGLPTATFQRKITTWLEEHGLGHGKVNYKLRDWLFSRQRYWGEPFPLLHELDANGQPTGVIRPLAVSELPLTLPDLEDYKPTVKGGKPEAPLEKATDWLYVERDGKRYRRETNTMPQWAGSCWYYLRYIDPRNDETFCAADKQKHWMPVDLYVGGAEHAVLHLLYSRFWHKVLFDRGHVHSAEPFGRLINQGMILGETEYTAFKKLGEWVSAAKVDVQVVKDEQTGQEKERIARDRQSGEVYYILRLEEKDIDKRGEFLVLKDNPRFRVDAQANSQGEMEYTAFRKIGDWVSAGHIDPETGKDEHSNEQYRIVKLREEDCEKSGDHFVLKANRQVRVDARAFKMSKSRGNVINPDKVVHGDAKTTGYGADSLRLYEMFMGPLEATKPWSMQGVDGVYRFLSRVWRVFIDDRAEELKLADAVQDVEPDREALRQLHRAMQKVTEDLEAQPVPRFNTAISAMMELNNYLTRLPVRPRSVLEKFVLILSPFAPHLGEELWHALGHAQTLAYEPWPTFDAALAQDETIEVPVQINGKLRVRLTVAPTIDKAQLEAAALGDERVKALLEGKQVKKVIVVPGKLVNFVIG